MGRDKKNKKDKNITPFGHLPSDSRQNPPTAKPINEPIRISFEHIHGYKNYCLSRCDRAEIKDIMDALRQITTLGWNDVRNSGGRPGNKEGLGYTPYPTLNHQLPAQMSNMTMAGIRANSRVRILGFHYKQVFYLLMFNRDHSHV